MLRLFGEVGRRSALVARAVSGSASRGCSDHAYNQFEQRVDLALNWAYMLGAGSCVYLGVDMARTVINDHVENTNFRMRAERVAEAAPDASEGAPQPLSP